MGGQRNWMVLAAPVGEEGWAGPSAMRKMGLDEEDLVLDDKDAGAGLKQWRLRQLGTGLNQHFMTATTPHTQQSKDRPRAGVHSTAH